MRMVMGQIRSYRVEAGKNPSFRVEGNGPNLFKNTSPKYELFPSLLFYNEFLLSGTIQNSGNKKLCRNTLCALYIKPH